MVKRYADIKRPWMPTQTTIPRKIFSHHRLTKHLKKDNFKKEEFIWAHSFRGIKVHEAEKQNKKWEIWQQEQEAEHSYFQM